MKDEPTPRDGTSPGFPHVRGRLLSVILSAIIGPPIAGFLFGVQGILYDLAFRPGQFKPDLLFITLVFMVLSFKFGLVPALAAMLGGWALLARRQTIPLGATLLATLVAMVVWLSLPSPARPGGPMDTGWFIAFFPPVLLSAALCWRFTRRWHSPIPARSPGRD